MTLPPSLRRNPSYARTLTNGEDTVRWFEIHTGYDQETPARILDIGSADGRVAAAFTRRGNFHGFYMGLEINERQVEECSRRFRGQGDQFRFVHADVFHSRYNSAGREPVESYVFPFEDDRFDYVIVNSVLIYFLPGTLRQYLNEIRRVLAPGGLAFTNHFVINQDFHKNPEQAEHQFDTRLDGCFIVDPDDPERFVAYEEPELLGMIDASGLQVHKSVPGFWCRDRTSLDQFHLDILVLSKSLPTTDRARGD